MQVPQRGPREGWARRLAWHWPLLPVLAVAAALRLVGLFPNFYHGDEAEYALVASYLADDWRDLAYPRLEGFASTPFVSQPPLVLYVFALAIQATGSAETGPILASVAFGLGTVAVTYAIGVRLRDRWLGALAGLFLAVLPFHVGISRGAQLDAGLTFFFALAMLLFLRWSQQPTWSRAFVVGVAAAACMLAKLPGVLVLLPMAVVALAMAAPHVRPALRRDPEARHRLLDLGGSAGIAGLPVLLLGTLYVAFLWSLGATTNLLDKLGWQAGRVAGDGTRTFDRPWHWYFSENTVGLVPQLGMAIAILAVAGAVLVALALRREPRDRWARLALVAWPLALILFFAASDRKEWFYLMPAMPAMVLLAAWPLQGAARELGSLIVRPAGFRPGPAVATLCVLVLLATALPVHASISERIVREGRYGAGVREAAEWIGEEDPDAAQVGTVLGRFTLHFYNRHDTYHYFVNHTYVEQRIDDGHVRYVVIDPYLPLRYERQWLEHLVEGNGGELVHTVDAPQGKQVLVYRLDPGAPPEGNQTA